MCFDSDSKCYTTYTSYKYMLIVMCQKTVYWFILNLQHCICIAGSFQCLKDLRLYMRQRFSDSVTERQKEPEGV